MEKDLRYQGQFKGSANPRIGPTSTTIEKVYNSIEIESKNLENGKYFSFSGKKFT